MMRRMVILSLVLAILASLGLPSTAAIAAAAEGNQASHPDYQKYAILIGISDYPGSASVLEGGLDLFYADDDAEAMRSALISQGFRPQNITVLTNHQATRETILDRITKIRGKASTNDSVVFYFSGHGVIENAAEEDPVYGLWPEDAPEGADIGMLVWGADGQTDVILDTELKSEFDEEDFETNHIFLGFDCCWSARFNDLAGDGRVIVTAAGDEDYAIAGEYGQAYSVFGVGPIPGIGWMNQGLFTYFFAVKGLTQNQATDINGDGIISVQEAFYYAQFIVSAWSDQFEDFGLYEHPEIFDGTDGDFKF